MGLEHAATPAGPGLRRSSRAALATYCLEARDGSTSQIGQDHPNGQNQVVSEWHVELQRSNLGAAKSGSAIPYLGEKDGLRPDFGSLTADQQDLLELVIDIAGSLGNSKNYPSRFSDRGQAPLLWVARNGLMSATRRLLNEGSAHAVGADGLTPLCWAARNGQKDLVELLLAADVTTVLDNDVPLWFNLHAVKSRDPLDWAVEAGDTDVLRLMIECLASFEFQNTESLISSLGVASGKGSIDLVKLMLDSYIQANRSAGDVWSGMAVNWMDYPLTTASSQGHEGVVSLLLDAAGPDGSVV